MKFLTKWLFPICFGALLAACVATTTDPAVGKADFAKLEQWAENVEKLEEQLSEQEPKSQDEAVKLLDSLFDQAIKQAKALELRHTEVTELRNKVVEGLGYQRVVMRSMLSPKYSAENMDDIYLKAERFEREVDVLYEKLRETFGEQ